MNVRFSLAVDGIRSWRLGHRHLRGLVDELQFGHGRGLDLDFWFIQHLVTASWGSTGTRAVCRFVAGSERKHILTGECGFQDRSRLHMRSCLVIHGEDGHGTRIVANQGRRRQGDTTTSFSFSWHDQTGSHPSSGVQLGVTSYGYHHATNFVHRLLVSPLSYVEGLTEEGAPSFDLIFRDIHTKERIDPVDYILWGDASVQTHPGFQAPAFDMRGDPIREDREVTNQVAKDGTEIGMDATSAFCILSPGAQSIQNVGQVGYAPVLLLGMRRGFVVGIYLFRPGSARLADRTGLRGTGRTRRHWKLGRLG